MKTLYIVRGLPGSGKTTKAIELSGDRYCEADQYFGVGSGYAFRYEKIIEAHKWCLWRAGNMMEDSLLPVAVANTFSRRWEYSPYLELAALMGWRAEVIVCKGVWTSVHNVPKEAIATMRLRWED